MLCLWLQVGVIGQMMLGIIMGKVKPASVDPVPSFQHVCYFACGFDYRCTYC